MPIRRPTVILLLVADLALLGYAVFQPWPELTRVHVTDGVRGRVGVLIPASEGEEVMLTRVEPGGVPARSEQLPGLAGPDGALAPLGAALHLFNRRGVFRIQERDAAPDEDVFDVERFHEHDFGFEVEGAANIGDQTLICGRTSDGLAAMRRYDGFEVSPVEGLVDVPADARRVAVASVGADEFVVAFRGDGWLRSGFGDRDGIRWRPDLAVRGDGDVAVAGHRGAGVVFVIEDDGDDVELLAVETTRRAAELEPIPVSAIDRDARLVGAFDGGDAALALADVGGSMVAYSVDGERTPPPFIAAWSTHRPRFHLPMFLHVMLFVMLGMLSRRPTLRRPDGEPTPEPTLHLAPLAKRSFAFVIDLVFAALITAVVFRVTFEPVELSFLMTSAFSSTADQFLSQRADFLYLFLWTLTSSVGLVEAWSGRSVGKRLVGLRVVATDASELTVAAATTRALFLMIDFVNLMFPVGLAFVLLTRRRQRLGDLVGGTVVVIDTGPPEPRKSVDYVA